MTDWHVPTGKTKPFCAGNFWQRTFNQIKKKKNQKKKKTKKKKKKRKNKNRQHCGDSTFLSKAHSPMGKNA